VELLVLLFGGIAPNGEDDFHFWIEQAFAQDALPDHTCRPQKNHLQM
jgi:hypothetical protein